MRKRNLSHNTDGKNPKMIKSEIEILETPVKSESDKKDYRYFRISKNKLNVLVISHAKLLSEQNQQHVSENIMEHSGDEDESDDGSDVDCEKSGEKLAAASLCIDVGSFHDAETGIPGMAHFVEHMIFMGSEKYPDENAYDKFITVSI
jgi:hypothetical protein